jgi:hypothetical protein
MTQDKGEIVMNKFRNKLLITKPLCAILLLAVFIAASAQAQMPVTGTKSNHNEASRFAEGKTESRLWNLLALARPARRAGFPLMPSSRYVPASANRLPFTTVSTAAAPSAVHGSGTVGKISMWVGTHPSGNSTLGDSIITQLNGNIGIGTTTPTSKLSVQGMIETSLGGYKFPDGTLQTTAAVSGLQSISHDATLTGNGTSASPLGVAIPLTLSGSGPGSILNILHTDGGLGVAVEGSARVKGADVSFPGFASFGVQAIGGNASAGGGGDGVRGVGGDGISGGEGVRAVGGNSSGAIGGNGVNARGGDNTNFGFGGHGVTALGGIGIGGGRSGGIGIIANGGLGQNGAIRGEAGHFIGNVEVSGNLSKGGGSFKIDHPLDPENKYLYHSFVESPDMKNIYDGNITTDENGEATVTLPDYFEALNRDFRYQLTVIGTFAQAIVAEKIKGNRFRVKTNAPNVEVSWQVTGVRQDAYANKHRIPVEAEKTDKERGFYLHPEAFNQSEDKDVLVVRHPSVMRQMKESRLKQGEEPKQKAQSNDR